MIFIASDITKEEGLIMRAALSADNWTVDGNISLLEFGSICCGNWILPNRKTKKGSMFDQSSMRPK